MNESDHTSIFRVDGNKKTGIEILRSGNRARCRFFGAWLISFERKEGINRDWQAFVRKNQSVESYNFEFGDELRWDSSLIVFLARVSKDFLREGKSVETERLPQGARRLLDLNRISSDSISSSPDRNEVEGFSQGLMGVLDFIAFFGEWLSSLVMAISGKSSMRMRDLLEAAKSCGASALPIVTLISFLTGLTMAFVGSVQLEKFNAKIYIADLVSLAMVREMGALMVGIIMSGRTGAAFAAEIGNMKLNEEIDSLRTFGISPMEFLVLPRTLALFLMAPLLTVYADVVGILGGLTVGTQVMDFSSLHYFEQTQSALSSIWEVFSGLLKSLLFGLVIGMVGCYKGLSTGRDSAALGKSVTSAVVMSVTLIVVCDAAFEIIFSYLDLR
ncbi:MAG: ABC transporter permease [Verrucomicrobiota bacterium]|nr:ABC transporter permease [Verrucomicrobiota bacterium]